MEGETSLKLVIPTFPTRLRFTPEDRSLNRIQWNEKAVASKEYQRTGE
jgi:hypothetical protein